MFDKTMLVGGELRYLLRKRKTIANPEETVINLFEKSYDLMNLEDGINSEVFQNISSRLFTIRDQYQSYSSATHFVADLSLVSFEFAKLERSDRYREQIREFRFQLADLYAYLQNGGKLR
ncbi:hypothetical protein HN840_01890 [archaeon]|jgi:hypothetical protein|nr:hypothetical protein [archaeon]MBT3730493.1 hypothetical protein [archaeon]MBT4669441.1 hypothetical protein [archaeon]MBT5029806.1 hypothetical protein [archaeon]MBT7053239.1 hypothetical protein [archaeon]